MAGSGSPSAVRRYDKGERRFKHVGRSREALIELDDADPRIWIGKCPITLVGGDLQRLLSEAVPASNGDRDLDAPKKLYVVHEGAIYEAQTSDHGQSYHGYPYKGKLARQILEELSVMAATKGCLREFDAWVKKYIERHGDRK